MATTTIRVSTDTGDALQIFAQTNGTSMQQVIEKALELYRRQEVLDKINAAYAALRENPIVWNEIEAERDVWDAALADGWWGRRGEK